MYSCLLTKITSNHKNLRDDIIQGYIFDIPEIDQPLLFFAEPRDIPVGSRRIVTTSILEITVIDENCLQLKTLNSVYKLSNIKELPNDNIQSDNMTKDSFN